MLIIMLYEIEFSFKGCKKPSKLELDDEVMTQISFII
jgi:hypothetical protein